MYLKCYYANKHFSSFSFRNGFLSHTSRKNSKPKSSLKKKQGQKKLVFLFLFDFAFLNLFLTSYQELYKIAKHESDVQAEKNKCE